MQTKLKFLNNQEIVADISISFRRQSGLFRASLCSIEHIPLHLLEYSEFVIDDILYVVESYSLMCEHINIAGYSKCN